MLKRLKYGKEFERLFAEYYNRMYYRAYHYVNDTEISKDIVSDAFGYVWEHYEALRKIDTVAVLFQQVRSRSIDFFRHRKVVERYADLYLQLTLEEEVPLQEEDERLARIADGRCVPAMYWKSVIFTGKNMQKWPKILELVLMP